MYLQEKHQQICRFNRYASNSCKEDIIQRLHPYTWTVKRQLSASATTTQETHLITNTSARPATLP
jgi:hypothetical protein